MGDVHENSLRGMAPGGRGKKNCNFFERGNRESRGLEKGSVLEEQKKKYAPRANDGLSPEEGMRFEKGERYRSIQGGLKKRGQRCIFSGKGTENKLIGQKGERGKGKRAPLV